MKKNDFKEILKKCFGKEKNDQYHAVAMLIIYGIFMLILIIMIRIGGNTNQELNNKPQSSSPTATQTPNNNTIENPSNDTSSITESINYSYSYTVSYNGNSEVFLGKKINNKEKFTHIKDGITNSYAILDDNYLILENDIYHITNNPNTFFKYCDISEILSLVDDEIPTENNGVIKYQVPNNKLAISFKDKLAINNELNNSIILTTIDHQLKTADLDLTNYISSVTGTTNTLTIHMEFVDVGSTEDFNIQIN